MAMDAWKNFELSGKISDYLTYRQSTAEKAAKEAAEQLERGTGSYGTERDSDRDGVKCHADWRV